MILYILILFNIFKIFLSFSLMMPSCSTWQFMINWIFRFFNVKRIETKTFDIKTFDNIRNRSETKKKLRVKTKNIFVC